MTQKPIGVTPFTITLAMVIGLELLFRHLFGNLVAAPWQQLGLMGGLRLLQAVTVWFCLNHDGAGTDRLGLKPTPLRRGMRHGFWWCVGFGISVVVGCLFAWLNHWSVGNLFKTTFPQTTIGLALFIAVGGIVGPIAEELVFRGLVYSFFRRWGIMTALLTSTLLFVAAHGTGTFWPVPLVGGIVFALSYEWSQSLATPIMIHVAGNLAIFSMSGLLF